MLAVANRCTGTSMDATRFASASAAGLCPNTMIGPFGCHFDSLSGESAAGTVVITNRFVRVSTSGKS